VQEAKPPPSREHSKVAPDWSEVKLKVASVLDEGSGGLLVIVATGGTATTKLRVAVATADVAVSVASTSKECCPWASWV
jgi:hypothetical protein